MKKRVMLIAAVMMVPLLSSCTTYVRTYPPQPPRAVIYAAPAPYPGAVWIEGHYGPYGGWVPGHWRRGY